MLIIFSTENTSCKYFGQVSLGTGMMKKKIFYFFLYHYGPQSKHPAIHTLLVVIIWNITGLKWKALIGPSEVCGTSWATKVGHYFRYFGPSGVRALPLGVHRQNVVAILSFLWLIAHYTRRDCHRVLKFCAGKFPLMLMGGWSVGLAWAKFFNVFLGLSVGP